MPGGQEPKEKKRKRPDRREDATEYVEELKKDEQEKREEREAAWAEQELSAKVPFWSPFCSKLGSLFTIFESP